VVRVHSQTLFYSDAERRADFQGTVTAQDPDGVIRADQTQVYLVPSQKSPAGSTPHAELTSGQTGPNSRAQTPAQTQIDHIVATGHVVITQPGRKGVGEKLVYTADDGRYVLTGTPGNPPHVYDQIKGTTSGATLIFNSQDDSVVVSGGQSRAVTDTRTPK
jgi:lipopolysaccharide export system protein LptA